MHSKYKSHYTCLDLILRFFFRIEAINESPDVQALIKDQIYHNFVEKMIETDHKPLAEEFENEDNFVPGEFLSHVQ